MRLDVTDIFNMADGRTVLLGNVDERMGDIKPGIYDLVEDGIGLCKVAVEGEMIALPRRRGGQKAVSTLDRLDLPSGPPSTHLVLVQFLGADQS